ncbi:conserved exported hypothetical protein [Verrucomicrobia bacterium]|nr:conserved exported hypothetical protein [Verrucomicrobiota bacterium]
MKNHITKIANSVGPALRGPGIKGIAGRGLLGALVALLMLGTLDHAAAQGTAFSYQGQLENGGSPANGGYDLRFSLYDVATGGTLVAGFITNSATPVSNGLFTVVLDFGAGVFGGTPYWLQIGVRTNGGGAFAALSPRQELTPAPYAIYAEGANAAGISGTIPAGDLGGTYGNIVDFSNSGNSFTGNGAGLTGVNAATLGGLSALNFWNTSGNAGTAPPGNFLGTTDNNPLELHVSGIRGLRLEPDSRGLSAPNFIGGYVNNAIQQPGSGGDFIAGGGVGTIPNLIFSNSSGVFIGAGSGNQVGPGVNDSVVGGGRANTVQAPDSVIVGGYQNTVSGAGSFIGGGGTDGTYIEGNSVGGQASVVVGGLNNTNTGYASTIGGGLLNKADSTTGGYFSGGATVGGGSGNSASTDNATVGGGVLNKATAFAATVPGGSLNVAGGQGSFAAGQSASTTHPGTFIWGDGTQAFSGADADSAFNALASGGVFFYDGSNGVHIDGFGNNNGTLDFGIKFGGALDSGEGIASKRTVGGDQYGLDFYTESANRMSIAGNGFVGINTTSPSERLEVNGDYVLIDGGQAGDGNGPIDAYIHRRQWGW